MGVGCDAGLKTCVIGVPKTIDGDLKSAAVATSFGFDTACKVGRKLGARQHLHRIYEAKNLLWHWVARTCC
jgi:6-phosphofructokinase